MRTYPKFFQGLLLAAGMQFTTAFTASAQHDHHATEAPSTTYACPMHPEVTSTKPGACSKCGMALVAKATKVEDHHQSGEGHAHKAPHGGTVVTADKYHIEMVAQGDKVTFYLLDGAEKTIPNKGVTGVAMFQFADKKTANMDMTAKGDDRFEVVPTNASDFTVIVTFTKGEEKISARLTSGTRGAMPAKQPAHNDGHNHQH